MEEAMGGLIAFLCTPLGMLVGISSLVACVALAIGLHYFLKHKKDVKPQEVNETTPFGHKLQGRRKFFWHRQRAGKRPMRL
jgi:hypothetical protein